MVLPHRGVESGQEVDHRSRLLRVQRVAWTAGGPAPLGDVRQHQREATPEPTRRRQRHGASDRQQPGDFVVEADLRLGQTGEGRDRACLPAR